MALVGTLAASEAAYADCSPAAANNVTAVCTGTTINQQLGAPGTQTGTNGYGGSSIGNLDVTVKSGATVTGSNTGLRFGAGTISNDGSVTGISNDGVQVTTSLILTNTGNITGGRSGVTATTATVTNSGTITSGGGANAAGLSIVGVATVINSGSIVANNFAIIGGSGVIVTNSGVISGGVAGIKSSGTGTVNNSGTISGASGESIVISGALTVTNSGTIVGNGAGVHSGTIATVTNSGTIAGANSGVVANDSAFVTNSGVITGGAGGTAGVLALGASATVTNSGTISGANYGIASNGVVALTNSGSISGLISGVQAFGAGTVTTSGTIIGSGGTAVVFDGSGTAAPDTLTVLSGARFGGLVDFGGGADTVNFAPGSWVLNVRNFDAALSTVNTGGNPYFVTGNQIVVADVSGFAAMNRAVMDITGWISSVLPETPVVAPGPADPFAALDTNTPRFEDAFASVPPDALGYMPTKAPVFNGGTVTYADGSSVWTKEFGGRREQQGNGTFIGSTTIGYGGAMGYERRLTPDLNIGGFVGASRNTTELDVNAGGIDTDAVFGGVYGRAVWGASFLDLALIGGRLDNTATRNISGGLGTETANASYNGWFVNPALTVGHRFALDDGFTLTPAFKARYVDAHFDGYTETGSSANLTVGSRTAGAVEERVELTLAKANYFGSNRVTARVSGGVLGQQQTGDSTVNIALLGQNFAATTPDARQVAGYFGGAGLDWQIGRVVLFASGEASATDDSTKTYLGQGGVRVIW